MSFNWNSNILRLIILNGVEVKRATKGSELGRGRCYDMVTQASTARSFFPVERSIPRENGFPRPVHGAAFFI